ncbi:potassium channel family protein [Photobacterium sp.]|uniref:potassium channel family protein n=1 Tax=Photobacterium sp. TaxID=660 RepID=UPI00299D6B2F|nr:ion channel [Photobacterium sp.]MDX1301463.1 ion channel [Photobacterium sp.]
MTVITKKNNFFYLTFSLIALLVASSLAQALPQGLLDYFLQFFIIVVFLVCLISLKIDQNWYRFLLTISACMVATILVHNFLNLTATNTVMMTLVLIFFAGTFKSTARQILFTGAIDGNKIIGSVALFLLLGLIWAMAYLLIIEFSPYAIKGLEPAPWGDNFSTAAYFSFVTLTTLGYGDISPVSPVAQVLVYLEAIAGVFYMAIVVSSLVNARQDTQNN